MSSLVFTGYPWLDATIYVMITWDYLLFSNGVDNKFFVDRILEKFKGF